jgi:hypothetical protein
MIPIRGSSFDAEKSLLTQSACKMYNRKTAINSPRRYNMNKNQNSANNFSNSSRKVINLEENSVGSSNRGSKLSNINVQGHKYQNESNFLIAPNTLNKNFSRD